MILLDDSLPSSSSSSSHRCISFQQLNKFIRTCIGHRFSITRSFYICAWYASFPQSIHLIAQWLCLCIYVYVFAVWWKWKLELAINIPSHIIWLCASTSFSICQRWLKREMLINVTAYKKIIRIKRTNKQLFIKTTITNCKWLVRRKKVQRLNVAAMMERFVDLKLNASSQFYR